MIYFDSIIDRMDDDDNDDDDGGNVETAESPVDFLILLMSPTALISFLCHHQRLAHVVIFVIAHQKNK